MILKLILWGFGAWCTSTSHYDSNSPDLVDSVYIFFFCNKGAGVLDGGVVRLEQVLTRQTRCHGKTSDLSDCMQHQVDLINNPCST